MRGQRVVFAFPSFIFRLPSSLLLVLAVCTHRVHAQADRPSRGFIRTTDNVSLWFDVAGTAASTVVALHGGPGVSSVAIKDDLTPLSSAHRVVFYDQRGGGSSSTITSTANLAIAKHVADLEAVRRYFKLEKLTLLGNSWGGVLAMYYAIAHPDRVERIILHSPGEPTKAFADEASDSINARLARRYSSTELARFAELSSESTWRNADHPRDVCREFYRMLLDVYTDDASRLTSRKGTPCGGTDASLKLQPSTGSAIIASLGDWNLLPKLARVIAPVLIIYGESDPIPLASAEAWAKALPNARLLVIRNAGHFPHIEQPAEYFRAVETFLKGEWPEAARK